MKVALLDSINGLNKLTNVVERGNSNLEKLHGLKKLVAKLRFAKRVKNINRYTNNIPHMGLVNGLKDPEVLKKVNFNRAKSLLAGALNPIKEYDTKFNILGS